MAIRQAVFDYEIHRSFMNINNRNEYPYVVFLWISETANHDPDDALLNKFPYPHPLVCKYTDHVDTDMGARDKKTGKYGRIIYMGKVNWINENQIVCDPAGGPFNPSNYLTLVKQKNEKWKVVKEEMPPPEI